MKKKNQNKVIAFGSVSAGLHRKFKTVAKKNGKTSQAAIEEAMMNYIDSIQKAEEQKIEDQMRIVNVLAIQEKRIQHIQEMNLFLCSMIGEILKAVPGLKDLKSKLDEAINKVKPSDSVLSERDNQNPVQ